MSTEKYLTMTENQNRVLITQTVQTALGAHHRVVYTIGPDNDGSFCVSTVYQARVYRAGTIALEPHKAFRIAAQVSPFDRAGLNAVFLGAEITDVGTAHVNNKMYWWYTGVGFAELVMDIGDGQPAELVFSATWVAQTAQVWPALSGIAVPAPDVHIRVWKGLEVQVEVAALAAMWLKVWGMRMA